MCDGDFGGDFESTQSPNHSPEAERSRRRRSGAFDSAQSPE